MAQDYIIRSGMSYVPESGKILLIRCPKCGTENYAMAVSSGQCYVCGYNAHNDEEVKKKIQIINNKLKEQYEQH